MEAGVRTATTTSAGEAGTSAGTSADPGAGTSADAGAQAAPEHWSSVEHRLAVVLGQMIRWLRRETAVEVGPASLGALATLARSGPLRLGDLAAREGVAPPTLTRMVAGLEEAGHVVREPDPRDRRAARVAITDSGLAVVERAAVARRAVIAARLEQLPPEVREAVALALPALEALAQDGG